MRNFYKQDWMEKVDSFFTSLGNLLLWALFIGLIGYIIYRNTPYYVGKVEFYEKEFHKNHPNF
jgi:hypothetical protein